MNDVASLELSKELYELSAWQTRQQWAKSNYSGDYAVVSGTNYRGHEFSDEAGAGDYYDYTPAYSLGYLLRKLPEEIDKKVLVILPGERPHIGYAERDNYGYYTLDDRFYRDAWSAINLEDAAAKLAIELFKQGVLTKETV